MILQRKSIIVLINTEPSSYKILNTIDVGSHLLYKIIHLVAIEI